LSYAKPLPVAKLNLCLLVDTDKYAAGWCQVKKYHNVVVEEDGNKV
jgi:hypothetical protein